MPTGDRRTNRVNLPRAARKAIAPVLLAGGLLAAGPACNGDGRSNNGRRTMSLSSGEFSRGYQDGMKDAEASLFDASGGWMWLWMMEEEYRKGYDRGWQDGRSLQRMKAQQPPRGVEPPADAGEDATRQRSGE
jgi:hypothetical protein